MTLVDTNVIVDILTADLAWMDWSIERLSECRRRGPLRINEVGYAELAVRMDSGGDLQRALVGLDLELERTPTTALFLAGKAFGRYRAACGVRTSLLSNFFIGAHAQVARLPLLTRDTRRYRSCFPNVELVAPGA